MRHPLEPISDEKLFSDSLEMRKHGRVLLIACRALVREILALIKANGLTHMDLQCLPATYHNEPNKIRHQSKLPSKIPV